MSTAARVREATADDVDRISAFEHTVDRKQLMRRIGDAYLVLIVERDARVIGYLRTEFLWSRIPYIGLIGVAEQERGKGLGRRLLETLEESLRVRGYTRLLSSSQADEPEPQAWHRHMGFAECGILSGLNEGGIGEVFFVKNL